MVMVEFFCLEHKTLERYSVGVTMKTNVSPKTKIPKFHPNGDLKCITIGKEVNFNEVLKDIRKHFRSNSIKSLNIKSLR